MAVFHGDNGQGKSNLLEAIYLLATTKSPRATAERELINCLVLEGELPFARLCSEVQKRNGPLELEIVLQARATPTSRGEVTYGSEETPSTLRLRSPQPFLGLMGNVGKRIRMNGIPRRAVDVVGQVNVVLFSTQDIELMGGPPSLRRRHLDVSISQTDRRYLTALQEYNKVLLQRNHLLRLIQEGQATADQLAFWDDKLVEKGSYLISQRRDTVAALGRTAPEIHLQLTNGQETLKVVYLESTAHSESEAVSGEGLPVIAKRFREALADRREREIARGVSLVGPHRDDLQFFANGVDMGVYGSRGQQRTIALALHLAEARLMRDKSGEEPVILLDDVLSELDERRRRHLLEYIQSYQQVVLTTTDLVPVPRQFLDSASVFKVVQGTVI